MSHNLISEGGWDHFCHVASVTQRATLAQCVGGGGGTQRWVQEEGDAGVIMEAVDLRISN